MSATYFHDMVRDTPSRVWVNNPTREEVALAREQGAIACTTNPAFTSNQLKRVPETVLPVIHDALAVSEDDAVVADAVQMRLVQGLLDAWRDHYDASGGTEGWVSIQGDPAHDDSTDAIVAEIRRFREMGPNVIAKIPATVPGFAAIETLLAEGCPVIVTEVFALAQARRAAEVYRRVCGEATGRDGNGPAYYVTHITGIFDEHLQQVVEREGIAVDPADLAQAGLSCAREQYRIAQAEGHPGTMLGGGARGPHHLTELVGGSMQATLNWKSFVEAIEGPQVVEDRIHVPVDHELVERLRAALPVFRAAWDGDGLRDADFIDYGPVRHFRDQFVSGWQHLTDTIAERRRVAVRG